MQPKVLCDLPFSHIPLKRELKHLDGIDLADPGFGSPGKIDMIHGIDVFMLSRPAEWTSRDSHYLRHVSDGNLLLQLTMALLCHW